MRIDYKILASKKKKKKKSKVLYFFFAFVHRRPPSNSRSPNRLSDTRNHDSCLGVSSYPCAAPAARLYFSRLIIPSWSLVTCTLVTWHQGRRRYIALWSTRSRCSPDSQVHLSMLWKIKSSIVECTSLLLVLLCSIWHFAKWIARWSKIDVNERWQ